MKRLSLSLLFIAAGLPPGLGWAADAERGRELYESRCEGCHSLDANRIGPMHRGVVGRKAGTVPGYDYSTAVRRSNVVWSETSLDRWLAGPEQFIRGQKMGYRVDSPEDRADLIAFLKREGK